MQEGHALTVVPWLARGRCFVEASARRRGVAPWLLWGAPGEASARRRAVAPWLARGRCFVEASARRRAVAPWLAGARSALCGTVRTAP